MTDQQHPITIPPDLEEELLGLWPQEALQRAAQWGADQELQECCEWLDFYAAAAEARDLRAARRPKPPSLAEEALEELQLMEGAMYSADLGCDFSATRRALERLQELEEQADD